MTDTDLYAAPSRTPKRTVKPEWIDYNGHMNVAYYVLAFDNALDDIFTELGIGSAYIQEENKSYFVLETHVQYLQEVTEGDPLDITFHLIDWDEKRLHYVMEMHHAEEGFLAATSEQIGIHIDMTTRRSAPMPDGIRERLARIAESHAGLERPSWVGRTIGIRRKA